MKLHSAVTSPTVSEHVNILKHSIFHYRKVELWWVHFFSVLVANTKLSSLERPLNTWPSNNRTNQPFFNRFFQTIRLIVSLYMVKWKTKLNSSQKKRTKLKHTSTPVQAASWYHCNKRLWKVNTVTYVVYHMRVMVQLFLSTLDVSVSWKYDYLHPSWLLKLRLYLDSTRVKSRKDTIMTIRVFTFPHF